ncbi:MAG: hypothetical protein J5803_05455 [Desulfovibrio sp.]|nr:hypothetical protein [Desulfovibrio sp.]
MGEICQENLRLDAYLAALFPDKSLRTRRRMIALGHILVNGALCKPGYRLKAKDTVTCKSDTSFLPKLMPLSDPPRFVSRQNGFYFFYKPAKLHTVHLSGSTAPSLEKALPQLCAEHVGPVSSLPSLVQRLDYGTSGLLCAVEEEKKALFLKAEEEGLLEKKYLALIEGAISAPFLISNALDTDSRKKTRVLPQRAEISRYTFVFPLVFFPTFAQLPSWLACDRALCEQCGQGISLVGCSILRGARHQIRAHLAYKGHPLVGDGLYGRGTPISFYLHQCAIHTPFASEKCLPAWIRADYPPLLDSWIEKDGRSEMLRLAEEFFQGIDKAEEIVFLNGQSRQQP